jgi:hypothetical protein
MLKTSKYLSFLLPILLITACGKNNNIADTGIAVEISKEQRAKAEPNQTIIAQKANKIISNAAHRAHLGIAFIVKTASGQYVLKASLF